MTKIIELVNFHTAYGSQVRLHDHYYDDSDNRIRMSGYVPIRAHRTAFQQLAKAQLPDRTLKDKVFMLTGSYGTGKSHLCLMLANYFSHKSDVVSMQSFFANWAKRDQDGAQQMRNMRGDGRYLVAICEFGTGKPFEDMVLSSIEEALSAEGAENVALNSHFKGVLRQIEEWEKRRAAGDPAGAFDDFLRFLGSEEDESELEKLKKDLEQNVSRAMERFQDAYQKAIGQRFSMHNDSLKAVLEDLLRSPEFKQRYRGLVILADEFGYALSDGKVSMSVFQSFAEMAKDGVEGIPLIFVGTGHRNFEAYANVASGVDFRVVRDRITEVSLLSEELEQIIAALVSPKKEDSIWKTEIQGNWLLGRMANETTHQAYRKGKLFDYLTEPELLDQIVQNIYPMHPLSVFCLTKMSQDLGSDARSVFSFFRQDAGMGSYIWFVNSQDVKKSNGSLNIYTPDLLVKYFETDIDIDSPSKLVRDTVRESIRNYRAAVEEVNRQARSSFTGEVDPFVQQILDLMFVYKISTIPITASSLMYGLNLYNPDEKKPLENVLKSLRDSKVIFMGSSGELEFRRSDMADVEALIQEHLQEVVNQPLDFAERITKIAETLFETNLPVAEYNSLFQEDKRLRRVFATPQDLLKKNKLADGSELSFWDILEQERKGQKDWKDRYEGVIVYVLCEDENDIQNARQAARGNHAPTILVGIPREPIPVKEKIQKFQAVQRFMDDSKYQKLDTQEKSLVEEIHGKDISKTGRIGEVIKTRDQYLSAQGLTWYQQDGKILVNQPKNAHEPADALMSLLYTKRNTVPHPILNLAHPPRFAGARDNALREAVARLVDYGRLVEIDADEKESQGEIRYLRNVFSHQGLLHKNSDHLGSIAHYELVQDIVSYQNKFPALVELVNFLRGIQRGQKESIWQKLKTLSEAPYGLGPYALSLFLAVAVRYLGDELRLKPNPTQFGYSSVSDPDIIISVATGQYPNATVERVEKTQAVTMLIDGVYNLFTETPAPAATHHTQNAAWQTMLAWWKKRTRLECTSGIYPSDSATQKLAEMMTNNEPLKTAAQTFLDELKEANGFDPSADLDEAQAVIILDELGQCKQTIESHTGTIKSEIINSIGKLFTPQGITYMDYSDAIRAWLNGLHPDQKDKHASWQTATSRTLLDALPRISDVEKMLLEEIPNSTAFGYSRVDDWTYDRSKEYIERFMDAKEKIDNGLPKVPAPFWSTTQGQDAPSQENGFISYHAGVDLRVTALAGTIVRVTRETDPIKSKQFEVVGEGTTQTFSISESCSYYLVSNAAGEYSKIIELKFRNQDDDYKLIPEAQGRLDRRERYYNFRNPVDSDSLMVLLNNLILHIREDGLISEDEIAQAFGKVIQTDLGSV
ncbi:MAG: hypothetical protein WCG34_03565 [Leptolinea sp.]